MTGETHASVAIAGGGPAGLALAIDLGRKGVTCVLFEETVDPPTFPKANSTTSRTMEHYRRMGIADSLRDIGLPMDYPNDISYHTRLTGFELARFQWKSKREALRARADEVADWPTPEPMMRGQQMFIEPILRKQAAKYPTVDLRFGTRVESIRQTSKSVEVDVRDCATGKIESVRSDYLVGCDGPRSVVRKSLGIKYEGPDPEKRAFLGGDMVATHFRCPSLYSELNDLQQSWFYWILNPDTTAMLMAIDGENEFVLHTQVPDDYRSSLDSFARESIAGAFGQQITYEVIDIKKWTAGFTLVAETYQQERCFIAGDAAHLFTPTAGLGYNTSVDDVANLAWKLAATIQGWAGPRLLDSYTAERKPVAERNTGFARHIANFWKDFDLSEIEDAGDTGVNARAVLGKQLAALAAEEFSAPGIHFGVFYGASPVISLEDGDPPPDNPNRYVPHGRPGARAPHAWMDASGGRALQDLYGDGLSLVRLHPEISVCKLVAEANRMRVPLSVVDLSALDMRRVEATRSLFEANLAIVRPDHHIAWRGNTEPSDPRRLLNHVLGFD